jgi:hypothetical protein
VKTHPVELDLVSATLAVLKNRRDHETLRDGLKPLITSRPTYLIAHPYSFEKIALRGTGAFERTTASPRAEAAWSRL